MSVLTEPIESPSQVEYIFFDNDSQTQSFSTLTCSQSDAKYQSKKSELLRLIHKLEILRKGLEEALKVANRIQAQENRLTDEEYLNFEAKAYKAMEECHLQEQAYRDELEELEASRKICKS